MTQLLVQPTPIETANLYDAQKRVLEQLTEGMSLAQVLESIVRDIELRAPGLLASILLVENGRLRSGAAPSLPEGYNRAVDGVPIGEGMGSCGTAAFRRQPVIVSDIERDPLWKNYRDIARRYQLGACWSTPIMASREAEVLGTFALYYHEPRVPRPEELWLVGEYSQLARVAIDHWRIADRLCEAERAAAQLMADLDGIAWEADPETRQFLQVSARAEQLLGYPVERWVAEPDFWTRILHEEDREPTLRRWQQVARTGRSYECEYRVLASDGRVVWIRELAHMQAGSEGRAKRLRGVMVNISRQRDAEQAREELLQQLMREQELIRAVVQQLPQAVVVAAAPSGRILFVNDQVERMARRPVNPTQHLEEHAPWVFRPDGRRYAPEEWPFWRVIRDGEIVIDDEVELLRGDGTRCRLLVSAAPVRDRQGQILAGVIVFNDVSEQRRLERADRFLVDAGAALLGSLDADATLHDVAALAAREFADWCLVFCCDEGGEVRCEAAAHRDERRAADVVATLNRLLGQPGGLPFGLGHVLARGGAQLFSAVGADAFEPGAVRTQLVQLVRSLGVESAMTVAIGVGAPARRAIVYCASDKERRYGPEEVAVAEELARRAALALENARLYRESQEAIKLREQFLSIAAHELKTPLGALQLALQSLLLQLGKGTVELHVLTERARAGERQCKRFARLVNELLDVSRIQSGQLRIEPEEMDLVEAIAAVVARLREEAAQKGIDVAVHAPAPVAGAWDRLRIEQVVTNLISNALKYGRGRPVRIAVSADTDWAQLAVEDQGIGMAPELLAHLFRPFERGVAPGEFGGLGLGLYITDQIVRAHGGRVRVHSVLDHGSTFTVELPRRGNELREA